MSQGAHPATPPAAIDAGAAVFVVSDAITFVALLAASAVLRSREPSGAPLGALAQLAGLSVLLLAGSVLLSLAQRRSARGAYLATAASAFAFVLGELYEWRGLLAGGHGPAHDLRHGSLFVVTGLHALHVFIGGVVAVVLALRSDRGRAGRVLGWYWLALDLAWIGIVLVVYR